MVRVGVDLVEAGDGRLEGVAGIDELKAGVAHEEGGHRLGTRSKRFDDMLDAVGYVRSGPDEQTVRR